MNGVKRNVVEKESAIKPVICPRCDTINSFDAKYCMKCAGILDIVTATELVEETRKEKAMRMDSDEMMNRITKDKEGLRALMKIIKELGLEEKVIG